MAINPRMYETKYGFDVLDTFHNFFPEMMYDTQLFPSNTFHWMRHRIATLFPDVYVRQQAMYRMYSAQGRVLSMEEWRAAQGLNQTLQPLQPQQSQQSQQSQPPQQSQQSHPPVANIWMNSAPSPIPQTTPNRSMNTPTYAAVASRSPTQMQAAPTTPQNQVRGGIPIAPNAPARQRLAHPVHPPFVTASSLNITDPMANIITEMLRQPRSQFLAGDPMLLNMLAALGPDIMYEDVIVAPTPEQINEGSAIVTLAAVPEGTNCAICQERGESQEWRRIYCNHYFHNTCISTWYQRSTECPVCRADIRDAALRTMAPQPQPQAQAQAQGSEPMSDSKEDT